MDDNNGQGIKDYNKLITPLVGFLKHPEETIVTQAFKTLEILCKTSGAELLNEMNVKGDLIRLCTAIYCTQSQTEILEGAQKVLLLYAGRGYNKDIGIQGKALFLEKIAKNCQSEDATTRSVAYELVANLVSDPTSREKIISLPELSKISTSSINALTVPTPLSAAER